MMHYLEIQWNERNVKACLEDAATIHRRLPEVKVQGYYNLWPDTLKDEWERLYDTANGKSRLGPPMPPEVTYHESIMQWLLWLDPYHQKVVWMRANRLPWKILTATLGHGRTKLIGDWKQSLSIIVGHLNASNTDIII